MMQHSTWIKILATASVGIVVGSGAFWQHRLRPLQTATVTKTDIPTVFVAGDYARAFSTNGFVHRLSQAHLMTRALIVNVSYHGQVHVKKVAPLKNNPTIQVIFADNHHSKRQARQLVAVMRVLKQRYHVSRYNAVGHSSGGNIIFDYLTTAPKTGVPKINKFVTIASTYPQATAAIKRLPSNLPILNIAGQIWSTSGDGEVALKPVLAFSHALTTAGFTPVTHVIHGSPFTAEHSMLHINPAVDRLIVEFLYQ